MKFKKSYKILLLVGERERWEATVERLDKEFDNLPGDCLIATGFIAYLGPFVSEYRESLMADWFVEVSSWYSTLIVYQTLHWIIDIVCI